LWANAFHCYIGEDTTTVTIPGHNALIDPIGASPGTPPNAMAIPSVHDGTADGDWYMLITATWNPGTVAGTLGEAALYMKAPDKTQFRWNAEGGYNPAEVMISRLSSVLDFSSFIIDNTKPLVVNWTIHFKFA